MKRVTREREIPYSNAYIQNQGSSGETDIENRHMDMGTGEERVRHMETVTWKLTLSYVK